MKFDPDKIVVRLVVGVEPEIVLLLGADPDRPHTQMKLTPLVALDLARELRRLVAEALKLG
jgi:hypothetical protein